MTRRRIATGLAVAGLLLGVIVTRAVWQGRAALDRGDAALEASDEDGAIRWWRRAARWYVPLAPHVQAAHDRLEELATQAEAHGDVKTALASWEAVRSSILATRSFYTPFADRLDPANRRIAALMAAPDSPQGLPGLGAAEREAWHLAALARDETPALGWTLLALLGFGLWIGGAWLFAWRGLDEGDRLVTRVAARAGALVIVGLLLWMLGLHLA